MNAQSIPAVVIASISFYVGLYHLLIYWRRKQHREDLTFALSCLATGCYDVFCAGLYNAGSVAEGAQWQRMQFIALAFLTTVFLWFVFDYTGQKPGIVTYAFSAYYLLAVIIQSVDRSHLTWLVDQPAIKTIVLPLGRQITYYEATLGPFTVIQGVVGMMASTYILWISYCYYRQGYRREASPLLLALGFMYAAAINDTLVSQGVYQFIYGIEYGYLAMILLMAYSLSSIVVEAAMAKESLRASEERFRSLVETTSDWVWETDPNGVYTYASPRIRELLGYEPEEVIGKTPFDLMPSDEAQRISAVFWETLKAQKFFERLENTVRCKDGRLVVLETNGAPFFDANGEFAGHRGIDRDITKRKRAEELLKQSEERYRVISELVFDFAAVFRPGPDGKLIPEWNVGDITRITGYTPDELTELGGMVGIAHPDDLPVFQQGMQALFNGQAHTNEYRIFTKHGQVRWLRDYGYAVQDGQGHSVHFYRVVQDITERKQAEQALRESEARWQFALEGSGDGVWDWNAQTNQVYFSRQWKAMLGFAEHEIGDMLAEWDTRIHPDDRDYVYEEIRKHLEGETPIYTSEHRVRGKDGTYKWVLDRGQVIERTKDGKPLRVIGTHSDITRRRQTEAALRESEEKFRSIVENALVGIFLIDDAYCFAYANDELGRILHYSSEELVGMDFRNILSEESHAFVTDYYIRRRRGEQLPSRYELSVVRQDGQVRYCEMSATIVRNAAGRLHTMGQFVDITERKQAQAELARTQQLLDAAFEQSPVPMVLVTMPNMVLRYVNSAAARFLGIQVEEYRMRSLLEIAVSWKELKADGSPWEISEQQRDLPLPRALRGIETKALELELLRADGQRVWELVSGAPIWAADGTLLAGLLVMQDITARKQAEDALRETSTRLTLATRAGGVGVWDYDIDQNLLVWDDQMYALYGISRDTFGGAYESWRAGLHPEDVERGDREVQMALRGEKEFDTEFRVVWPDGSVHHIRALALVVRAVGGAPLHMIGTNWDITERKRAETEREALIADLEAKNAELERFTYTVSHDLKSPLITIGGFVGFLEKDALSGNLERVKADIVRINDALTRMQRLLDELLELSRVGRIMNPPEAVSLAAIAREAVESARGQIEARGVQVDIASDLPTVYGDRVRLVEVVQNLVDNACKFMGEQPHPRIEIGARQGETGPVFYVRDNGVGIEPQYHTKVFGLFDKLDPYSEGTGVGLALVKRIIETHGGKIWVESEGSGRGSAFCFTLANVIGV